MTLILTYSAKIRFFKTINSVRKIAGPKNRIEFLPITQSSDVADRKRCNTRLLGNNAQWIFLLYRRVQKIDEIEPDHCKIYQNNRNKKCN